MLYVLRAPLSYTLGVLLELSMRWTRMTVVRARGSLVAALYTLWCPVFSPCKYGTMEDGPRGDNW